MPGWRTRRTRVGNTGRSRTPTKHGPVKDADKREHPDFMPYEKLSPQAQRKDFLFAAVVAAFFEHYV
jgi:hypothetical protein